MNLGMFLLKDWGMRKISGSSKVGLCDLAESEMKMRAISTNGWKLQAQAGSCARIIAF